MDSFAISGFLELEDDFLSIDAKKNVSHEPRMP